MICEICGKEFSRYQYAGEYLNICSDKCFHHKYWQEIVAEKHLHAIIDGSCYCVMPETWNPDFHGYEYILENLQTGERIVTHNLWSQGKVPAEYRDQLPDSHKFYSIEDYKL